VKPQLTIFLASSLLVSTFLSSFPLIVNPVAAETLKGGVKEKTIAPSASSRLKRPDTNQSVDPFNTGGQREDSGSAQPPPGASDNGDKFVVTPKAFMTDPETEDRAGGANPHAAPSRSGAVAPPHNNRVNNGNPNRNTTITPSQSSTAAPNRNTTNPPNRNTTAPPLGSRSGTLDNDPEKSGTMLLQWDAWHKQLAQAIYQRFNRLAQSKFKKNVPLMCRVSYVVTGDQTIENVRVLQPSTNPAFDELVVTVVNSMVHHPYLQFPRGSQRHSVERSGTFTLNQAASTGFEYQKGDQEQIKH
jgi:hypothetical protein